MLIQYDCNVHLWFKSLNFFCTELSHQLYFTRIHLKCKIPAVMSPLSPTPPTSENKSFQRSDHVKCCVTIIIVITSSCNASNTAA